MVELQPVISVARCPKDRDACSRRERTLQQLKPLGRKLNSEKRQSGYVPSWPGQALHEADFDRIATSDKDDRDRFRRVHRRQGRDRANGKNDIDARANQFSSKHWQMFASPLSVTALNK